LPLALRSGTGGKRGGSIEGSNEIALNNVLGSNSINTYVILGLSALFFPLLTQRSTIRIEIPLSLFAAVAVLVLGSGMVFSPVKGLSRMDGVFLLICFAAFMLYVFYLAKKGKPRWLTKTTGPWA
jgi:cation:H+ antiporter